MVSVIVNNFITFTILLSSSTFHHCQKLARLNVRKCTFVNFGEIGVIVVSFQSRLGRIGHIPLTFSLLHDFQSSAVSKVLVLATISGRPILMGGIGKQKTRGSHREVNNNA